MTKQKENYMNGLIVSYFGYATNGRTIGRTLDGIIVGRTFDGRYVIQAEDGELDVLNRESFRVIG